MAKKRARRSKSIRGHVSGTKSKNIQRNARERGDARLRDAIKAWDALELDDKFSLAATIAETRAEELTLAFPDIVQVGFGFRTRNKERRSITKEPCVTFMVARKRSRVNKVRQLPEFLYAYWGGVGEERGTLCAVPTDVEAQRDYRLKPHGDPEQIRVSGNSGTTVFGVIACAVRREVSGTVGRKMYALSCHHVLGMFPHNVPSDRIHVDRSNGDRIGTFWPTGGLSGLRRGESFDAALAQVNARDENSLFDAMGRRYPKPPKSMRIPKEAEIWTPDGTFWLKLVHMWPVLKTISYFGDGGAEPFQREVIEWEVKDGETRPGHSGSPIVTRGDGHLLGMYISGTDQGDKAMMLPASSLLAGHYYNIRGSLTVVS